MAILPCAALIAAGAESRWLVLGAVSWVAALVIKLVVMAVVGAATRTALPWVVGLLSGVVSAAIELGIAALVILQAATAPALLDVLLFAVGAGTIEALGVLAWSMGARSAPEEVSQWLLGAATSRLVRYQFPLERAIAWLGQAGSRSLVSLAVVHAAPWLGWTALATFAVTDGAAAWGLHRGTDWYSARSLGRYFRLALMMVAIEIVVLAAWLLHRSQA